MHELTSSTAILHEYLAKTSITPHKNLRNNGIYKMTDKKTFLQISSEHSQKYTDEISVNATFVV